MSICERFCVSKVTKVNFSIHICIDLWLVRKNCSRMLSKSIVIQCKFQLWSCAHHKNCVVHTARFRSPLTSFLRVFLLCTAGRPHTGRSHLGCFARTYWCNRLHVTQTAARMTAISFLRWLLTLAYPTSRTNKLPKLLQSMLSRI